MRDLDPQKLDVDLKPCSFVPGDRLVVSGQDAWFPDGTVCQADKSLTSFCVEGRCEPFLCPSLAEGSSFTEEGYPSREEGYPSLPAGDKYPFLLHLALCQAAPSFLPGRPATDKANSKKFSSKTTLGLVGFTFQVINYFEKDDKIVAVKMYCLLIGFHFKKQQPKYMLSFLK